MGIINRGRPDGGQNAGTTVIAAGSKLVGDLALSDNLHIDGQVEGNVQSEAEVAIGQEGQFNGELQAEHVLISGHFEGNIDARRLEIVAGGRVEGDVTVTELVIEPGALFNGNSRVRETQARTTSQPGASPKQTAMPEPVEKKKVQPASEAKAG